MATTKETFKRTDSGERPVPGEGSYQVPEPHTGADTRTLIWAIVAVVIMLVVGYALAQRGTVKVEVQNPAGPQNQSSTAPSPRADAPPPVVPANDR